MRSGRIEFILRPNLRYKFDGRPLCGLEDWESGKNSTAAKLKSFRLHVYR